jgi:hypothetical protein
LFFAVVFKPLESAISPLVCSVYSDPRALITYSLCIKALAVELSIIKRNARGIRRLCFAERMQDILAVIWKGEKKEEKK